MTLTQIVAPEKRAQTPAAVLSAPKALAETDAGPSPAIEKPPKSKSSVSGEPPQTWFLDHALALAGFGYPVFPLRPNSKVPLAGTSWLDIKTCDADKIRKLWTNHKGENQPYNIGVACGDGLLVVDVDVKDGTPLEKRVAMLGLAYEDLPEDTFHVDTPSGGRHYYLNVDPTKSLRNSVKRIADHVDIKTDGGYVVGRGSQIDGANYAGRGNPARRADVGPELLAACAAKRESKHPDSTDTPPVELDTAAAIERATAYLKHAEPAIEGDGGDNHTIVVANRVLDFGLSVGKAAELMDEHWNDRCVGPWDPADLKQKIGNARKSRQEVVGKAAPEFEFSAVEVEDRRTNKPKDTAEFHFQPIQPFEFGGIPPRRWVLEKLAARRFVSALIAPAGTGKTSFMIAEALAAATGRGDIIGRKVCERTRVLLWNQEDDHDELRRRLAAVMQAFDVKWDDLKDQTGREMLFLESGVGRALLVASRKDRNLVASTEAHKIGRFIARNDIGLALFDPLIEFHEGDNENDNTQMKAVAAIFRDTIAVAADCAVVVAHHSRKPPQADAESFAGNVDSARGGSSLTGVVRIAHTLFAADDKIAKAYGIAEEERHLYVRLDDAKANLFLKSGHPEFFKRESVTLGGFGGEEIGVLRPVKLIKVEGPKTRSRDDLVADVFEYVRGAGFMTVKDLSEQLVLLPMRADQSAEGLGKAIKKTFADGVALDDGTITLCTEHVQGRRGSHAVLRFKAGGVPETTADAEKIAEENIAEFAESGIAEFSANRE